MTLSEENLTGLLLRDVSGSPGRMVVLPTVAVTVAVVGRLIESGVVHGLIGCRWHPAEREAESELLSSIHFGRLPPGRQLVIFTDQLVDAVAAPVLLERGGRQISVSGHEHFMNVRLNYPVHIWVDEGWVEFSGPADLADLYGALLDHLDACERLGSGWLARDLQYERFPDGRRLVRRHRIQALRSSLMHGAVQHPARWATGIGEKLGTLERLHGRG